MEIIDATHGRRAKTLSTVLVLGLGLMLSACASGQVDSGEEGSGADGEVVVDFNILGYSPNTPELFQEAIDDFEAENPGIQVNLTNGSWDTAHEQMLSWVNTGETPDITVLGPKWLPELIDLEALQPFDDYVTDEFVSNFPDSLIDPLTIDGSLYSIPAALSTRMMYYRQDLFSDAGVSSPPTTWDGYVEALKAVEESSDTYGVAVQGSGDEAVWNFSYYMLGAGGGFTDADGNWAVNRPENVEALEFLVSLVNEHEVTAPDPTAVDQDTVQALFTSGEAASYWGPPWTLPAIDDSIVGDVKIAPYPTKSGEPAPLYIQDSFALFADAEHPQEAVEFLEFWNQDQYQVKFNETESLIPVTTSAGDAPVFQDNEALQAFVAAIPDAESYPIELGWETVNVEVRNAVQSALLGESSPQDALDQAQAAIEADSDR